MKQPQAPDDAARLERFRSGFPMDDRVYLNNAGVAPMGRPAQEAASALVQQMSSGIFSIASMLDAYEAARGSFARLVGASVDHVSMTQTCAASLSLVALGLPLRRGAEIVTWDQEYPSNAYPWFEAARRVQGTVTRVRSGPDLSVDTTMLIDAIGSQTDVVAISWVQFQSGAVTDLGRVAERCREVDAWLVVDAIQGLGVMPFDLRSLGVDVVCGGTHKWLCGPLGHGFVAFGDGRRDQLSPLMHGTFTYGTPEDPPDPARLPRTDAYRFEPGSPLLFGAIAGAAAIEWLLEAGVETVQGQALQLRATLVEGIRRRGGVVLGQAEPDPVGPQSPITTFRPPGDVEACMQRLREGQIAHAARAGGIRVAPHGFNTEDDIEALLDRL